MISFLQFDGSCTVLGMAFDLSSSLIILIAIIFLMLIWKAVSSLFSESKIPSPKGNWLLGHLFENRKSKDVMQTFAEIDNLLQRAKSARQIAVCKHTFKQILTLLIITASKHFVLACAICHMPIHAWLNSCTDSQTL